MKEVKWRTFLNKSPINNIRKTLFPFAVIYDDLFLKGLLLFYFENLSSRDDPFNTVQAFLEFHDKKVYPPLWVLNNIADAFKCHIDSKGEKSLEFLFGFSRGVGKRRKTKLDEMHARNQVVMQEVRNLTVLFKCKDAAALRMVAARLQEPQEHDPWLKYSRRPLEITTLTRMYSTEWKKKVGGIMQLMPETDKVKYLRNYYPVHSWPRQYRKI